MDSSWYAFLVLLCGLVTSAAPAPATYEPATHRHIANVSHSAGSRSQEGLPSIFSPRMDFEQWKPLTGRGDPLRNDPTYDYEPPVLERVHYWADEPRPEREHRPERKSEVLMLGVSSRKPSVAPRQPPRRPHRPSPPNYEEFVYKLSKHYPMTILVPPPPPPPPPPGHKLPLFILHEDTPTTPTQLRTTEVPLVAATSEPTNQGHTSLYHLQEANLIYQSSTTGQNWADYKGKPNTAVSSDYAGWGPTTPIDEDPVNDTHNFIFNDHFEMSKHPFSFYRPMLSEAPPPPPPNMTPNPLLLPSFVPTALPPATTALTTPDTNTETEESSETTTEVFETETTRYRDETTSAKFSFRPTPSSPLTSRPETNFFGMLSPMMSMPLVNGAERPEDHLYAHASENIHIYKEQQKDDTIELESMQTMQPPPPSKATESSIVIHKRPFHVNAHILNNPNVKQSSTLDPYIHMRFATAIPTVASMVEAYENTTTEVPAIPTYLIIQGHSKVKTYSSKPKHSDDKESIVNEIPKPNESNEVRHLHPLKEKNMKNVEKSERYRANSARSLKSLLDEGVGSIEIQEANVGIKYDVSDGSDVPLEIYRKGIVESDENDYPSRNTKLNRPKRQISLTDLLPFDEDQVEDFVYNFLKGRKNETGITGLIAHAVTSETADIIDDDDDEDDDEEDR